MRSPAIAIAWELWRPNRYWWSFFGLYVLAMGILFHFVQGEKFFEPPISFKLGGTLCLVPLVSAIPYFAKVFAYFGGRDMLITASGFPSRMYALPLRTSELVAWPMFYGLITALLGWFAVAWLILRPCGYNTDLLWPGFMLAATLAWIQTIVWLPIRLTILRGVLTVVPSGIFIGNCTAGGSEVPTVTIMSADMVLLGLAYYTAFAGVTRSRRGDGRDPHWLEQWWMQFLDALPQRNRPFPSPTRALIWFDWRRRGIAYVLVVGMASICFLPFTALLERFHPVAAFLVPALLAAAMSGEFGVLGTKSKGSTFIFVRPMTNKALIAAKLRMAAEITLIAWGVFITLTVIIYQFMRADEPSGPRPWDQMGRAWDQLIGHNFWQSDVIFAGAVLVFALLTWRTIVAGLFIGLSGRAWVAHLSGTIGGFLLWVGFCIWMVLEGNVHEGKLQAALWVVLPWAAGLALVLKFLAAVAIIRILQRRGLASWPAQRSLVAIWLVIAVCLSVLVYCLITYSEVPFLYVAAAVVLLMPVNRLALMPLALDWNRHR